LKKRAKTEARTENRPMGRERHDFRNGTVERVRRLFLENGFSERRIGNFQRAFRSQPLDDLRSLKGVSGMEMLLPSLPFSPLRLVSVLEDTRGNQKDLFETHDGHSIESVMLAGKRAPSVCISVQAGCRFRCAFCQTGKMGFKRDLLPAEMLDQVRQMYHKSIAPAHLLCVSFMGMGEPLDNIENCGRAYEWLRSSWGWYIGAKKITFSTTGALNWERFFALNPLPNLAVSLHSPSEEVRRALMPRASIGLSELKTNMKRYTATTNKYVSIAYCMLKGVNDSRDDALMLADYVSGLRCKINLIDYNPITEGPFAPVGDAKIGEFRSWLNDRGVSALHRRSLGTEICAGCGQLGRGPVKQ
jgi:23S rRNA (adenine2503-C2)-methyltransferase